MAKSDDMTRMGGEARQVPVTHWAGIAAAQQHGDEVLRRKSVDGLISAYWKPVYCCIRCMGPKNEDAKDFTQGFFAEVFPGLIAKAERTKGKFRALLLTALRSYIVSQHRMATAKQRMPAAPMLRLDGADLPNSDDADRAGRWGGILLCPDSPAAQQGRSPAATPTAVSSSHMQ